MTVTSPDRPSVRTDAADEARALLTELTALRARVQKDAAGRMAGWRGRIADPGFAGAAENLATYLALRSCDLTALQPRLTALGLSSLGRAEAHVSAALDATIAALAAVAGEAPLPFPAVAAFQQPVADLHRRRDALFGPGQGAEQTRIMVTLPTEAGEDPSLTDRLVQAGADCVRINCAHDDAAVWERMIAHARQAGDAHDRPVRVEMDLGGPKLRTDEVRGQKARLHVGDRFEIVAGLSKKVKRPQATLTQPGMMDAMVPGNAVWLDDGKLRAVIEDHGGDRVLLRVTGVRDKGLRLKPEKGVGLPGVDLDIPALTDDDRAALPFVARHADLVAMSFVQTVADVIALTDALAAEAPDRRPAIILKIETPMALRNLPDLIVAAGGRGPVGVMIARGDLAVEVGFERLSEMQEEILWLCEAAHVPVIWATQVLEGLVKEGQASRAETTDAAMSQRAECVMLNKGPFLPEAVTFLRDILTRMDRHVLKKGERMGPLALWATPATV
ncbi:MAG: pyruvate kinase [Paracoccus sp. (in: a-proteobacteria)]|nr:pyruvate kinase [Paracoccus sp. (in: a-proteobacteria)]